MYQALAAAHKAKVRQTVNQVVGKGAGIWDIDALCNLVTTGEPEEIVIDFPLAEIGD